MRRAALFGLAVALCLSGAAQAQNLYLNPLPVYVTASGAGTPTDHGGTITTGGTPQTAIAANSGRKLAVCMNPVSGGETLYVAVVGPAATSGSGDFADLAPGGSVTIPGTSSVSVVAVTTGHRFYCTEWN